METTTRLLLPEVREALLKEPKQLLALTEEMHPVDLADLASALEPDLAQKLLEVLPNNIGARLLEACEEQKRAELFGTVALKAMSHAIQITDEMAADDRADLYADLPEDLRQQLLEVIDDEDEHDIRQLLSYPEDTAGGLMTTDFVALSATDTAADAIEAVRVIAGKTETIYQAYTVDRHNTLLGVVSLRDLVTSPANRTLDEIMNPNVVACDVSADQEEVARLIAKYDLLAIPVVDRSHHMLGICTVDDVIDVVVEEATEDAQKMGAVEPLDQPYLSASTWQMLRKRAPWLTVLFVAVLATENVLEHYSQLGLAEVTMLLWFVPVIISSGGNAGSQSATLIIRAMAVGRVDLRDGATVIKRELAVGVLLGLMLATLGVVRILVTESTRSFEFAGAIACSIVAVVTFGALLGAAIPLVLRRLGIDPAVSSTPFIASIVDICGLLIYFEIALLFFQ